MVLEGTVAENYEKILSQGPSLSFYFSRAKWFFALAFKLHISYFLAICSHILTLSFCPHIAMITQFIITIYSTTGSFVDVHIVTYTVFICYHGSLYCVI